MAENNTPEPGAENSVSAEDIAQLRAELEKERKAKEAAEARAASADQRIRSTETERDKNASDAIKATDGQIAAQKQAAQNAIDAATAKLSQAKRDLSLAMRAFQSGDDTKAEEISEAQDAIAAARLELSGAENWQRNAESWEADWEQKKKAGTVTPKRTEQPVRADDKTEAWIAAHPKFRTDAAYNAKCMKAHYAAIERGLDPKASWDDYIDFVETEIGERKAPVVTAAGEEEEEEPEPPPAAQPRRSTSTAAPVTRSVPGQPVSSQGQRQQLSEAEKQAAKISFPDEYKESPKKAYEAYIANKMALEADGKLTRH